MRTTRNRLTRAAVAVPMAGALLLGTAACAGEEAGAGIGEEEFGQLESDFTELEERVGVLEEEAGI